MIETKDQLLLNTIAIILYPRQKEGLRRMKAGVRSTERVCLIDNIDNLIDAKEHIVKSTFNQEIKDDIQPSHQTLAHILPFLSRAGLHPDHGPFYLQRHPQCPL